MVICSHYEVRFCFPEINCFFFFPSILSGVRILGTVFMKYDVELHFSLGTLLGLWISLVLSILKWSVGNGLLRFEEAPVDSSGRGGQKLSFCPSAQGAVCL